MIGTQVAGRTHAELDPIVGMFTNTVPLRMSLAGDPTFAGLLGRVRDITLDAMSHQQVPFEKLVEEFAPDRTLAHVAAHPGPVRLRVAHAARAGSSWHHLALAGRCSPGPRNSTSPCTWTAADGQTTTLVMEYSTDQFDPAWADRFLRCMAHLLEHAADAPGTPVADLPMLSATERDALIVGRNRRRSPPATTASRVDVRRLLQASRVPRHRRRRDPCR